MPDANQSLSPSLKYIQDCYMESFYFLHSRKRRQVRQLVLLNNLQRGDENIASTLLLTLFNRMMSSLYDDKLQIKFLPAPNITQDQLNSYNLLAQSDYKEMEKAKLDYDWIWDALFFGRGYVETLRFNKRRKIMEPQVINPLMMGYDPYFEEVNDWRYYWKWVTKSKVEIKRLIANGTITGITDPKEIPGGFDEYLWNYKILRDRAKKAIEPPATTMSGDVYQILEFYGYDEDGDKCCYWLDRNFNKVLWQQKLEFNDLTLLNENGEEEVASKWPIVIKQVFKEPHSTVNFSIADLLEDKHRAKSVLLNLAFLAAKDRANPTYLYNPEKIKDITQFFSRQISQHIPVEDIKDAVAPLNTQNPMDSALMEFIWTMEAEANNPMGSGMPIGNYGTRTNRPTATQMALEQQLNELALSLQSKVLQFGEQEFWSHWFHRYAKYGPELGQKMANVVGVKGVASEMINLKDFVTDYPPGILVYSAQEAELKEVALRRDLMQLYPELVQTLDPDGLRNFNKYVFFPKFLNDPSLVEVMIPKTPDEMKAETENDILAQDKHVPVAETDNHTNHIYIHNMLQPKTWALWFHLNDHEIALAKQRQMQQQMQAEQQAQQAALQPQEVKPQALGGAGQVGVRKQNPQGAVGQNEVQQNNQQLTQ